MYDNSIVAHFAAILFLDLASPLLLPLGEVVLKILVRYTFREILSAFMLAVVAFTSLLIVDKVFDLTRYFVEKGISPVYMVQMLFYFSPAVLVLTVPMAFLVGIVTAFGRLAADNEITAIKTSGISMEKLIVPVVLSSLVLSVFMVFFMDLTIPSGNRAYTRLNVEIQRKNPALVLQPGTIMEEMSKENRKWYFKSVDPKTGRLKSVRIWERSGAIPKLITAEEGELIFYPHWTALKLFNGTIYQADEKKPTKNYAVGDFVQDQVVLHISGSLDKDYEARTTSPRNMSIKQVKHHLAEFNKQLKSPRISESRKEYIRKVKLNEYKVELYKKTAIPFACLAFGLIGVPIGLMVRRGGRMVGLGVGFGLIIIYYVFLTGGEKAAKVGVFSPFLGAWTPNILTSVAGIILIIKTIREVPLRSSRLINKLFPPQDHSADNMEEEK